MAKIISSFSCCWAIRLSGPRFTWFPDGTRYQRSNKASPYGVGWRSQAGMAAVSHKCQVIRIRLKIDEVMDTD